MRRAGAAAIQLTPASAAVVKTNPTTAAESLEDSDGRSRLSTIFRLIRRCLSELRRAVQVERTGAALSQARNAAGVKFALSCDVAGCGAKFPARI
jgi:hypothetical protein